MSDFCGLCEAESSRSGVDQMDARATPTFLLERLYVASCMDPQAFLAQLEFSACELGVEETDRSYRASFTENYKPLFPATGRCYRAELLHACMNQEEQRMVNDQVYNFSSDTLTKSLLLKCSVNQLLDMLYAWSTTQQRENHVVPDLRPLLKIMDEAWAEFEKHYILDLIGMEVKARSPIVRAIALERELQALERRGELLSSEAAAKKCVHSGVRRIALSVANKNADQSQISAESNTFSKQHLLSGAQTLVDDAALPIFEFSAGDIRRLAETASRRWAGTPLRNMLHKLVQQIASLNACANTQGRGRGDLGLAVLERAAEVFLCPEPTPWSLKECDDVVSASMAARRFLASQVLVGFLQIRNYFTDIADRMLFVDPQLSRNTTLVARLTKWEESWELGAQFLPRPVLLESLCGLAGCIRRAQRIAPDLISFVENRDAELFLILPRLVLIFGFIDSVLMPLPASLLPHHFFGPAVAASAGQQQGTGDFQLSSEVVALLKQFANVCYSLSEDSECSGSDIWWQPLVRAAVAGPGATQTRGAAKEHEAALDCFLHRLEGFSMELQRHMPEDWNQCCSILTLCIDAACASAATQGRAAAPLSIATI